MSGPHALVQAHVGIHSSWTFACVCMHVGAARSQRAAACRASRVGARLFRLGVPLTRGGDTGDTAQSVQERREEGRPEGSAHAIR
eukprot:1361785-Alexandrium_andersonii.AAC.1